MISGSYTIHWDKMAMSKGEMNHIRNVGIRVLLSCEDMANWPKSIFMTLKLYFGGLGLNPYIPIFGSKIPEYQLNANLEWVKKSKGKEFEKLPQDHFIKIDKHQIVWHGFRYI